MQHRCTDCGTAGLTEQQRGFGIDVDKHMLDRCTVRVISRNYFLQAVEQRFQADGEFAHATAHATAGNVGELLSALLDNAETGNPQAGVDA